jgi:hypothetical protein
MPAAGKNARPTLGDGETTSAPETGQASKYLGE